MSAQQLAGPDQCALRGILRLWLLLVILIVPASGVCFGQSSTAVSRVHPGGIGRYSAGRWGLVGGTFVNFDSEQTQEMTTVVMPPTGAGLQFGREISIPPGVSFSSEWPVFVPKGASGSTDFKYLKFEKGKVDQVVHQEQGEQFHQSFGSAIGNKHAKAGRLHHPDKSSKELDGLRKFSQVMRFQERKEEGVVSLQLDRLSDHPEVFDPLEYLSLSHPGILHRPAVMESLRLWVQRGGRLVVAVDISGPKLWNGLFGSTAPLTVIQETSAQEFTLQLNPEYSFNRFPIRQIPRTFDTPLKHLRVVVENTEPIWNIEGWPVVVRLPFGKGEVIGLFVDAEGLVEEKFDDGQGIPWKLVESGGSRISEILYKMHDQDLVSTKAILKQANGEIGYSIPSLWFPILIAVGFSVLLVVAGIMLYKKSRPERLIWVVPILAMVLAAPPLISGYRQRDVAPPTVFDYRTVLSVPGQSVLTADGASVLYSPDGLPTSISSDPQIRFSPPSQDGRRESRRMMLTSDGSRSWSKIAFPAGLTSISSDGALAVSSPLTAKLSFNERGITGSLNSGSFLNPSDAILIGRSPEKMSLDLNEEGNLQGALNHLLPPDTYVYGSLLTEEQILRDQTLKSVFGFRGRQSPFPRESTVLYWAEHERPKKGFSDSVTNFTGRNLVVQPVTWIPPELDKKILIPAAAIYYQGIASPSGEFSSTYSNMTRTWNSREMATDLYLEFQIPEACCPFEPEQVDCMIRVQAPARKVSFSAGSSRDDLKEFYSSFSPLGTLNLTIPPEVIRKGLQSGRFIVECDVGELDLETDDDVPASGEQDDSWIIEQTRINLTGRRTSKD